MAKVLLYDLGKSISFGRLPLLGKVLWPMLLAACDNQGRGLAAGDVIKWTICPNVDELTAENIPDLLAQMDEQEMLHLYTDSRGRFLFQVIRWWEYQHPQWAQPSTYEAPEGWIDRVRIQRGSEQITDNWESAGGFCTDEPQAPPSVPPGNPPGNPPGQAPDTPKTKTKTMPKSKSKPKSKEETETAGAGAVAPATFQDWQAMIQKPPNGSNRTAVLIAMHKALFPGRDPPEFGYMGKMARDVGGAGRMAELLWQASTRPPTGDVLRYCAGMSKGQKSRKLGDKDSQTPEDFYKQATEGEYAGLIEY